jgi:Cytochrome P460
MSNSMTPPLLARFSGKLSLKRVVLQTTVKYQAAIAAGTLFAGGALVQSAKEIRGPSQETGKLDELRGILGDAISMKAYREGTIPFTDGAILVKLARKHMPSTEAEGAFVPGRAATVQIMVKDSKSTPQRRLGIRPIHKRQASGRGAAQNMLPLPLGTCERARLRLYALRALKAEGALANVVKFRSRPLE